MDTFDAISKRRSIRKFKPDPVPAELITRCLQAARLAPSGTNCQPWKFLVVRDAVQRQAIMDAAYGQSMFGKAPVVIVLLGDTKAYRRRLRTGQQLLESGAIDLDDANRALAVYQDMKDTPDNQLAIVLNCMLAGQNLVLEATEQGLGSCWVMLFKKDRISEGFALPKNLFPIALIPLGYPDQDPPPRPRYPLGEVAFDGSIEKEWEEK